MHRGQSLLAVFTVAGCVSGDSPTPVVERVDSSGVELVRSALPDQHLEWTLHEVLRIGGDETGPGSFYRVTPRTVAVDDERRIYVLDPSQYRVSVFDADGQPLRVFGSEGEGPGELSFPSSIAVDSAGVVSVFDYRRQGLVQFQDGEFIGLSRLPLYPLPNGQNHLSAVGGGFWVSSRLPPLDSTRTRHGLQWLSEADTAIVAEVEFPDPEMAMYESCGGGLMLPRIFETEISWDAVGESVVFAADSEYRLTLRDAGGVRRIFGRTLPSRVADADSAQIELGPGLTINFGRGPCTVSPSDVVEARGFAESIQWVDRVTLSPEGETWVRRKLVGPEPGPIDVFDASGVYVGSLSPETPFPYFFLDADHIAAPEVDHLDIARLVVFRIDRGGS